MSDIHPLLAELNEGLIVEMPLMVVQAEVRQSKTGNAYLHCVLRDASATIMAFMWDNFTPVADKLQPGMVVRVKARVQKYRNNLQLVLQKVDLIPQENVNKQDFMASSDTDVKEMWNECRALVDAMKDEHVKALITAMMGDEAIAASFKEAPAAKTMHHSYIGGLLEHTLSLMRLSEMMARHYPRLNRDILVAGAFLHDIGKIRELSHDGWLDYSREGRLIGHIVLGVEMLNAFSAKIEGFPPDTLEHLQHIVLSHHGEYEYGSPRRPKTREALTLHFLDNLDSHLNGFDLALKDQGGEVAFSRILERFVYDA